MINQNSQLFHEKVLITELTRDLANDLRNQGKGYFSDREVLNLGIRHEMLKVARLLPRATKLVAYHTEDKRPIGFLYLEENTNWLFSIKFVFVNPKYRNKGLATRLLNCAFVIAKEKGARKLNLNVWPPKTQIINLYRKLGFKELGRTALVQGYLSDNSVFEVGRRAIKGLGFLAKIKVGKKSQLLQVDIDSRRNRENLFRLYQRCVNQNWQDFFEINPSNLANGSRHVWQPSFVKHVLINNSANSFVLIFNRPFSQKATVELYNTPEVVLPSILKDLLKILSNRGIFTTQISLFNKVDNLTSNFIAHNNMKTFEFASMGKTL